MSPSSTPTRAPFFDNATARLTATVVLPTPPLPAPTAITFLRPGSGGLPCSGADTDRTTKRVSTSTCDTPGTLRTSAFARSTRASRFAAEGFADSIANATRSAVTATSLTNLSVTMSDCKSGSTTAFNAASTASGAIRNSAYHAREIGKLPRPKPEGDLDGRCDPWKRALEQSQCNDRVVLPVAAGAGAAADRERRQGSAVACQARARADDCGNLDLGRDQHHPRAAGHLRVHRRPVHAVADARRAHPARDVHRQGDQRPAPDHSRHQRVRQQAVSRRAFEAMKKRLWAAIAMFVIAIALDLRRPPSDQLTTGAAVGAIHIYQATLSPLYERLGVRCRFTPTCSHYGEAVIRSEEHTSELQSQSNLV